MFFVCYKSDLNRPLEVKENTQILNLFAQNHVTHIHILKRQDGLQNYIFKDGVCTYFKRFLKKSSQWNYCNNNISDRGVAQTAPRWSVK